jgi:CHAD domain-containing protein
LKRSGLLSEAGRERIGRFRKCLKDTAADPQAEDAVHDLRVSIRRVLAWISVREALAGPDRRLAAARASLKRLMAPLGKLRDAQVKREWIRRLVPAGDEPSRLYAILVQSDLLRWERRAAKALSGKPVRAIRVPGPGALQGGRGVQTRDDGNRLLARLWDKVARDATPALDPSKPEALHRLRLAFKKYRYAWEVLCPGENGDGARSAAKRLHAFQTLLGTIHDCDVILAEVRAFRETILGLRRECRLEAALRALRARSFREFRKMAGNLESLHSFPPSNR